MKMQQSTDGPLVGHSVQLIVRYAKALALQSVPIGIQFAWWPVKRKPTGWPSLSRTPGHAGRRDSAVTHWPLLDHGGSKMNGYQIQQIDSTIERLAELLASAREADGIEEIEGRMIGVMVRWETAKEKAKAENCDHCNGSGWRYDNHFTLAMHKCCKCKGTGKRSNAGSHPRAEAQP